MTKLGAPKFLTQVETAKGPSRTVQECTVERIYNEKKKKTQCKKK